jgi:hypothetical protein
LRTAIVGALLLIASARSAAADPRLAAYRGPDAGSLILSMSGSDDPYNSRHTLCLRSDDARGYRAIEFHLEGGKPGNKTGGFIQPPLDTQDAPPLTDGARYSASRTVGVVEVVRLQPGRYTIYWLDPENDCGAPDKASAYGKKLDVSFEIRPGAGLYVGDIFSVEVFRSMSKVLNPLHWSDPIRTRIAFRFNPERDVDLARLEQPSLGEIEMARSAERWLQDDESTPFHPPVIVLVR